MARGAGAANAAGVAGQRGCAYIGAMNGDTDLYDRDFVAWTEAQAAELRAAAAARVNLPIDWEHLAEEIESLGKSDARALENRLTTIIEHLLTLKWSPAMDPVAHWERTVARGRGRVALILRDSPGLRSRLSSMLNEAHAEACKLAARELRTRGEITASEAEQLPLETFGLDEVLGEWWPEPRTARA